MAARQGVGDAVVADAIGADGPLEADHGALDSRTNARQHISAHVLGRVVDLKLERSMIEVASQHAMHG